MTDTAIGQALVAQRSAIDDRPIDANAASRYLADRGFTHAPATLARLRCQGGGPHFLKLGARIRYRPSALDEWLVSRTRELRHTSEHHVA